VTEGQSGTSLGCARVTEQPLRFAKFRFRLFNCNLVGLLEAGDQESQPEMVALVAVEGRETEREAAE